MKDFERQLLERLRASVAAGEAWEAKASSVLASAAAGALPPLEDVERLVKEEAGIPATLEGSAELAEAAAEARRWVEKAQACLKGKQLTRRGANAPLPALAHAERLVRDAGKFSVAVRELAALQERVAEAKAWGERADAAVETWREPGAEACFAELMADHDRFGLELPAAVDVRACAAALEWEREARDALAFRRDGEDGDELAAGETKTEGNENENENEEPDSNENDDEIPPDVAVLEDLRTRVSELDADILEEMEQPLVEEVTRRLDACDAWTARVDAIFAESGESSRGAPERERESARVGSAASLGASAREGGGSERAGAGGSERAGPIGGSIGSKAKPVSAERAAAEARALAGKRPTPEAVRALVEAGKKLPALCPRVAQLEATLEEHAAWVEAARELLGPAPPEPTAEELAAAATSAAADTSADAAALEEALAAEAARRARVVQEGQEEGGPRRRRRRLRRPSPTFGGGRDGRRRRARARRAACQEHPRRGGVAAGETASRRLRRRAPRDGRRAQDALARGLAASALGGGRRARRRRRRRRRVVRAPPPDAGPPALERGRACGGGGGHRERAARGGAVHPRGDRGPGGHRRAARERGGPVLPVPPAGRQGDDRLRSVRRLVPPAVRAGHRQLRAHGEALRVPRVPRERAGRGRVRAQQAGDHAPAHPPHAPRLAGDARRSASRGDGVPRQNGGGGPARRRLRRAQGVARRRRRGDRTQGRGGGRRGQSRGGARRVGSRRSRRGDAPRRAAGARARRARARRRRPAGAGARRRDGDGGGVARRRRRRHRGGGAGGDAEVHDTPSRAAAGLARAAGGCRRGHQAAAADAAQGRCRGGGGGGSRRRRRQPGVRRRRRRLGGPV